MLDLVHVSVLCSVLYSLLQHINNILKLQKHIPRCLRNQGDGAYNIFRQNCGSFSYGVPANDVISASSRRNDADMTFCSHCLSSWLEKGIDDILTSLTSMHYI